MKLSNKCLRCKWEEDNTEIGDKPEICPKCKNNSVVEIVIFWMGDYSNYNN